MRWVIGPLGWLSHLPDLIRTPLTTVATTGSGIAVAGAVTVAATTAAITPVADPVASATAVERTITIESTTSTTEQPPALALVDDLASSTTSSSSSTPVFTVTSVPIESTTTVVPTTTTASSTTTSAPTTTVPVTTTAAPTTTTTTALTTTTTTTTTTAAPSTTTTTTTTTTTAAPTTTTTDPPAAELDWFLGSGGHTTTRPYLPLDGSLGNGPLPNYDTDEDDDPGLTIKKGDGLSETDQRKMQRWWDPVGGAIQIQGVPSLDIWVATKGFDTDKSGVVVAGLYDCDNNKSDCSLLTSGSITFQQGPNGSGFGQVRITMSPVDVDLAANRGLILKVAVPNASEDDVWVAYGTTTYPTQLSITQ